MMNNAYKNTINAAGIITDVELFESEDLCKMNITFKYEDQDMCNYFRITFFDREAYYVIGTFEVGDYLEVEGSASVLIDKSICITQVEGFTVEGHIKGAFVEDVC